MKTISFVIPNYNGAEILQQNLPIVLQYAQKYNAQVIIVDDASTDDSVRIIVEKFPHVLLIKKPQNDGFSSTVNLGVKNATTELVCLLNSDIIPSQDFLDPLLDYFNDPQTAAVGMMDLSDDEDTHGRGKFIFHEGFLLHDKLAKDKTLESGLTGWVSCGSGLFSKKIWDELGGLDELLNPFYFEDVDYGYRAWKAGYKMHFEKKAIVEHIHKKGAIKSNYDEQRIKTIVYRNQFIFSWKNLSTISLIIKHMLMLPINLTKAIINSDKPMLEGFINALKKLPVVLQKKSGQQKLTDIQIIEMFNE
jgi:GT2 family glycosyltransferase